MHTEPCHSRRPPPLTLLLRGFAAGLLLLLLIALSIRIHRGALSGEPTALASSSALAAASSAFTRTANRASEAASAASSAFTRTANRASEAASDTFVPERFTPPSGLPPGTTCEYLPPWLEAAMNSMVAKAVQLEVGKIPLVDFSLWKIRRGACPKPKVFPEGPRGAHQGGPSGPPGFYFAGFWEGYTPQLLPDAYVVRVRDVNVTESVRAHYAGVYGLGAFGIDAVCQLRGELEVVAVYSRPAALGGTTGNDHGEVVEGGGTKVTGCNALFDVRSTDLYGPGGLELQEVGTPVSLPFGRLLCYGPAALAGPLSGLVGISLAGEARALAARLRGEFSGLAPMLNDVLRRYLPGEEYEGWYLGKYAQKGGEVLHAEASARYPSMMYLGRAADAVAVAAGVVPPRPPPAPFAPLARWDEHRFWH
ncbi:hypothetical protein EMIHUDRAFT_219790 [Emiliania huxleyi CCMP1516]|uniref:Uncharacterized protein n=2 Tax=Emiliania huxleyi TaxID=2903 RepID=A0A0D3I3A7_EMIH1|nr:hypothetical protein EMIHUDRAFT_219790 [Emiliania huxleyi CCMP1516]EOD05742.1 hypothetical protein EMIHUDRAFT_219790 [Emiliania huxleyi CCMP1516]|eukprot:XP_005758171.1 hypothetical protein EMIHUDRAFT_219790 [Emiliania huxleyi CCMP1516]